MIFFYKILNGLAPKYLFYILHVSKNRHYSTRNQSNLELSQFFSRTKSLSNSFFPYCIKGTVIEKALINDRLRVLSIS